VRGAVLRHDNGRPEIILGRRPQDGHEEHEVMVSEFVIHYLRHLDGPPQRWVKVGRATPDVLLMIGGNVLAVEVDMGTMDATQMRAKSDRYPAEIAGGYVLFV